jgi:hypothetical protein
MKLSSSLTKYFSARSALVAAGQERENHTSSLDMDGRRWIVVRANAQLLDIVGMLNFV